MFRIYKKYLIFLIFLFNFYSCSSFNQEYNETNLKSQSFCYDNNFQEKIKYPECSVHILEKQKCTIKLTQLRPTQFNYGKEYVNFMIKKFDNGINETQNFLCNKPISIVIGPESVHGYFLVDGHHRMKMIEYYSEKYSNNFLILAIVERNFTINNTDQKDEEFWTAMQKNNEVYLKDNGVEKKPEELPHQISQLTNDPYRSFVGFLSDDKQNLCFNKKLTSYGNYAEFFWADYFRKFRNEIPYSDEIEYKDFKNKILSYYDKNLRKKVNLCKLKEAENLPGYTNTK